MTDIFGTNSNDQLNGDITDDLLLGLAGDDTLDAGLGREDTVDGGAGNDLLIVDYSSLGNAVSTTSSSSSQSGSVLTPLVSFTLRNRTDHQNIERFRISGGTANDTLSGDVFNDTLNGNAGDDILDGGLGNDIINGGRGNDTVTAGDGADTLDGGSGSDTLVDADLSLLSDNLVLNIDGSTISSLNLSDGTTISGFEFFEDITSGIGNDRITIDISTPAADNTLNGGAGNDTLDAGLGREDTVDGGAGNDLLIVDYSSLGNAVSTTSSSSSQSGSVLTPLVSFTLRNRIDHQNIERFRISGGTANDTLSGGVFNDTLNGNAGDDILDGDLSNDNINGGSGSDTLIGNAGNDTLRGGSGADAFRYNSASEGIDQIIDYSQGQDIIEVSASGFDGDLNRDSSILNSQFVLGTTATTSEHRFIYNSSDGSLFFDVDGNGNLPQELLLILNNTPSLTANDIEVI